MWTFSTFIIPAVYLYLYTSSYLNTNIIQISIQTSSTVMQDTFGTFCLQQSFLWIILSSTYRLQQRHQFGPILDHFAFNRDGSLEPVKILPSKEIAAWNHTTFCFQQSLQLWTYLTIHMYSIQYCTQILQYGVIEDFAFNTDSSLEI